MIADMIGERSQLYYCHGRAGCSCRRCGRRIRSNQIDSFQASVLFSLPYTYHNPLERLRFRPEQSQIQDESLQLFSLVQSKSVKNKMVDIYQEECIT